MPTPKTDHFTGAVLLLAAWLQASEAWRARGRKTEDGTPKGE